MYAERVLTNNMSLIYFIEKCKISSELIWISVALVWEFLLAAIYM